MLGRLELEPRTLPARARMDLTFQVQRLVVALEAIREPPEPRAELALCSRVEGVLVCPEVLRGQRGPDAVREPLAAAAEDGQLQDAANEEVLAFDDAKVIGEEVLEV